MSTFMMKASPPRALENICEGPSERAERPRIVFMCFVLIIFVDAVNYY
jgi:hypothetical protein